MVNSAIPAPPGSGPPSRPNVQDIQGWMRRYIPFSSRFLGNQKSGLGQDVVLVFAAPNVDVSFVLALGQIPSRYVVHWSSVGGVVFNGANQGTDWTPVKIVLRASLAGTYHATVF